MTSSPTNHSKSLTNRKETTAMSTNQQNRRSHMNKLILTIGVMTTLLVAGTAQATIIVVKPTAVTATSNIGHSPTTYQSPNHMIDGSGLSSALNTGDPAPGIWPTHTTSQSDLWVDD